MTIRHWLRFAISGLAIGGAVYLLANGNEYGWGWLLFLAFCALP